MEMEKENEAVKLEPSQLDKRFTASTVLGNIIHIRLAAVEEMCWYPTEIVRIVTHWSESFVRMSKEEFMDLQDKMKV